jgi:hypothetical protein
MWLIIIIYLALCYAVSTMSDNRNISGSALFILSLILSPFGGFIIALLYPTKSFDNNNEGYSAPNYSSNKTCPMCAEEVKAAAKICKHCRYEFN